MNAGTHWASYEGGIAGDYVLYESMGSCLLVGLEVASPKGNFQRGGMPRNFRTEEIK